MTWHEFVFWLIFSVSLQFKAVQRWIGLTHTIPRIIVISLHGQNALWMVMSFG
jgi:hypothetical protein